MIQRVTIVLGLVLIAFASGQENKVRVHVFYESLCPDSMRFINQQFVPNYADFADYIDVILVPFGKSQHVGAGQFVCQHGPSECRLNKIQSCSLYGIPDQPTQVKYVGCQMGVSAERTGEICVTQTGLDWDEMSHCHDTDLGTQLQLAAEREQQRIIGYPKFVPTIVLDEQFDQDMQDRLFGDFKETMCEVLNRQPPVCQESKRG